jgi:hypothetical protein
MTLNLFVIGSIFQLDTPLRIQLIVVKLCFLDGPSYWTGKGSWFGSFFQFTLFFNQRSAGRLFLSLFMCWNAQCWAGLLCVVVVGSVCFVGRLAVSGPRMLLPVCHWMLCLECKRRRLNGWRLGTFLTQSPYTHSASDSVASVAVQLFWQSLFISSLDRQHSWCDKAVGSRQFKQK